MSTGIDQLDSAPITMEWLRQSVGIVQAAGSQQGDWVLPLIAEQLRTVLVPRVLAAPQKVDDAWQRRCDVGWSGKSERVHADRDKFRQFVERKLATVVLARQLVALLRRRLSEQFPEEAQLAEAEARIGQFKSKILDRWNSLEDLEDLIAGSYPLSNERLLELAEKNPPPASWFQEDDKPF